MFTKFIPSFVEIYFSTQFLNSVFASTAAYRRPGATSSVFKGQEGLMLRKSVYLGAITSVRFETAVLAAECDNRNKEQDRHVLVYRGNMFL